MALDLQEIKELIAFGRENGLQTLVAEGIQIVFGAPPVVVDERQPTDESALPPELRHYSARGREALGKR